MEGKKRIKGLAIISAVFMLALCCRLFYIQVMCREELAQGALSQQIIKVQTRNDRGVIYDRNMIRLTDRCQCYYYLIRKENYDKGAQELLAGIGGQPAGAKGEDYLVFKADRYAEAATKRLIEVYDAYVFCGGSRYEDTQSAVHLIGYIRDSEETGASGLEKMFQDRLASSSAKLLMMGDGIGRPIKGIGVTEEAEKTAISPSAVVTTIDSKLQKEVEQILEDSAVKGAVVVLDSKSGQVLAMASTPSFNPNRVGDYLNSKQSELVNKAVQGQYPPGSVFKIVVAAAALESGLVDAEEGYDCRGSIELNGVRLICDEHPEGHGKVNLKTAFAKSCNCYFARLAGEIGSETIMDMAQRMGLGQTVIEGFPEEEAGAFPAKEDRIYSGLSNFAVGQGSLLVTPIQIARLTNIIAAGGISYPVTIVMNEGIEKTEATRVMTETTALRMQKLMESVFTEGTASGAELLIHAAGKTGSAESGNEGAYTVHGWFTGYFPAEDPEYTVTVLAENGKTGSSSALPVFEQIADYLY